MKRLGGRSATNPPARPPRQLRVTGLRLREEDAPEPMTAGRGPRGHRRRGQGPEAARGPCSRVNTVHRASRPTLDGPAPPGPGDGCQGIVNSLSSAASSNTLSHTTEIAHNHDA